MPAEFFPLKLIFNRCVFSASTMTVYRGMVPQVLVELHDMTRGRYTLLGPVV